MNYVLEDGVDFNAELMKALCDDTEQDEDAMCLIDGQPLAGEHVRLICGHKFNYQSIVSEVARQKRASYAALETQKLGRWEVKCPYCRSVQNGILPHMPGSDRVEGVNWPPSRAFRPFKCAALLRTGKRKGEPCAQSCHSKYCKKHQGKPYLCAAILKSGKRKGAKCGCGAAYASATAPDIYLCGKHKEKKHSKKNIINTV